MDRDIYFEKVKGCMCIEFDYCTSIDYDVLAESYEKEIDFFYNAGIGPELPAERIAKYENGEIQEYDICVL